MGDGAARPLPGFAVLLGQSVLITLQGPAILLDLVQVSHQLRGSIARLCRGSSLVRERPVAAVGPRLDRGVRHIAIAVHFILIATRVIASQLREIQFAQL